MSTPFSACAKGSLPSFSDNLGSFLQCVGSLSWKSRTVKAPSINQHENWSSEKWTDRLRASSPIVSVPRVIIKIMPQTWWLKIKRTYSLIVWEVRSLRSRHGKGYFCSKALEDDHSLSLLASGGSWHSVAFGSVCPISASIFPWPCFCVYSTSYKDTIHWI